MELEGYVRQAIADNAHRAAALRSAGASSLKTERFIWRVTYRGGVVDSEEYGEGFARVKADLVERIELLIPELSKLQGGDVGIHHDIPSGASAVFTRRRIIGLLYPVSGAGWTIIGHQWPDGTGLYFFFHNSRDAAFASEDFNDPRSAG